MAYRLILLHIFYTVTHWTERHLGVCWCSNIRSNSWWGRWAERTWKCPRNPWRNRLYRPTQSRPLRKKLMCLKARFIVDKTSWNTYVWQGFSGYFPLLISVFKVENSTCCRECTAYLSDLSAFWQHPYNSLKYQWTTLPEGRYWSPIGINYILSALIWK